MPPALNFLAIAAVHPPSHSGFLVLVVGSLIILGLTSDAVIIARFLPSPRFLVTPKAWGLRQLLIAISIVVGISIFSSFLYEFVAWLRHQHLKDILPLIIVMELISRLVVLAGFAAYFRSSNIRIREALGLNACRPLWAIGWGIVFTLAVLPPVGVAYFTINELQKMFRITPSAQPIVELFLQTDSRGLLAVLVFFAIVVAPVFEEFLFRGFAYPALKKRFGVVTALVIVSFVFALIHFHPASMLPLFILALGLGLAYELTGSLLASIVMHSLFNAFSVLQVFYQRSQ